MCDHDNWPSAFPHRLVCAQYVIAWLSGKFISGKFIIDERTPGFAFLAECIGSHVFQIKTHRCVGSWSTQFFRATDPQVIHDYLCLSAEIIIVRVFVLCSASACVMHLSSMGLRLYWRASKSNTDGLVVNKVRSEGSWDLKSCWLWIICLTPGHPFPRTTTVDTSWCSKTCFWAMCRARVRWFPSPFVCRRHRKKVSNFKVPIPRMHVRFENLVQWQRVVGVRTKKSWLTSK